MAAPKLPRVGMDFYGNVHSKRKNKMITTTLRKILEAEACIAGVCNLLQPEYDLSELHAPRDQFVPDDMMDDLGWDVDGFEEYEDLDKEINIHECVNNSISDICWAIAHCCDLSRGEVRQLMGLFAVGCAESVLPIRSQAYTDNEAVLAELQLIREDFKKDYFGFSGEAPVTFCTPIPDESIDANYPFRATGFRGGGPQYPELKDRPLRFSRSEKADVCVRRVKEMHLQNNFTGIYFSHLAINVYGLSSKSIPGGKPVVEHRKHLKQFLLGLIKAANYE